MENKNTLAAELAAKASRFESIADSIKGPETAASGKQYFKVLFDEKPEDGYFSQPKALTKLLWEDSHSALFTRAQKAQENGGSLKIKAAKMIIPTPNNRKFYVVNAEGERSKRGDGSEVTIDYVTIFALAGENIQTLYNQAINAITKRELWVNEVELLEEDEIETDEIVEQAVKSPAPAAKKK